MAYNENIPQAGDRPSASRPQLLENFTQIKTLIDVNHVTFGGASGQGKHKFVTFPQQAVAPAPAATEIALSAQLGTTGNTELFIANGSTGTNYQMTAARKNAQGWTMTPAGILIKWGSATIASAAGGPFNFTWPAAGTDIAFGTQYWAIIQVGADPGNTAKDVNAVCYVTSVANPALVTYRVWRRNQFNTPGTDQQPFTIWVLAFGTP
jgi:hypothetical protein